jgi:hypothetical protein
MKCTPTVEDQHSLRIAIDEFFNKAALCSTTPQLCKNCGQEMNYLQSTFFLYGTDSSWTVRIPACECSNKIRPPAVTD